MKELKQKLQDYKFILPYLGIAIILFLAGFNKIGHFGVYSDDWIGGTYITAQNALDAAKQWLIPSGEMSNFRPLAVIESLFWYFGYISFGLFGVFFTIYLIQLLATILIYIVFKRLIGNTNAFFGALLFILFPTQSFYLWQVTSTYFLALSFILLAVITWQKKARWWSVLLLLISLLINESVFGLFILAIIPSKWEGWKVWFEKSRSWFLTVIPVTFIYATTRIIYENYWLVQGGRIVGSFGHFNFFQYIIQFFKAASLDLILAIPIAGWKILYNFNTINWSYVAIVAFVVSIFFYLIDKKSLKTEEFNVKYIILVGFILLFAGRYYGFYYIPSINILNLDSRHYFASSIGAAMIITAIISWLASKNLKWYRFTTIFTTLLIIYLCIFKISLQTDYVQAWSEAKKLLPEVIENTKYLGDSEAIVINLPPKQLGKIVDVGVGIGDLRITIPKLYGQGHYGISSNYIQQIIHKNQQTCFNSMPIYICFPSDHVTWFEWDGFSLKRLSMPNKNQSTWTVQDKKTLNQIIDLLK